MVCRRIVVIVVLLLFGISCCLIFLVVCRCTFVLLLLLLLFGIHSVVCCRILFNLLSFGVPCSLCRIDYHCCCHIYIRCMRSVVLV